MSISDKIIEVIEDTYGVDNITQDTPLEELDICSDLRLISLVSLLETELGINIYISLTVMIMMTLVLLQLQTL